MSAYMCDNHHIQYIIEAAKLYDVRMPNHIAAPGKSYQEIATILQQENAKSVKFRYGENSDAAIYDPVVINNEHFIFQLDQFTTPQIVKSVRCYQYQSCEHPEWESSEAKRFCDDLIMTVIDHMFGYDEAVWGAPYPD